MVCRVTLRHESVTRDVIRAGAPFEVSFGTETFRFTPTFLYMYNTVPE